jgi:hypothetical protein
MKQKKIITMLELQDVMNSKVNADWRKAGYEWYRAIWMESSEMLEHYGWKWWKKQHADVMQVKLEVVDIVHFALSLRLVQGNEQGSTLDEIAEGIAADFANPFATFDIKTSIELLQTNPDRPGCTLRDYCRCNEPPFDVVRRAARNIRGQECTQHVPTGQRLQGRPLYKDMERP